MQPYDDASAIIQYAMFLAIVVLNGYVIVTCHTKVKSKTRLHFFMVHLAYAGRFSTLSQGERKHFQWAWGEAGQLFQYYSVSFWNFL